MEFSSKRFKLLSGLLKEDVDYDPSAQEPEPTPTVDPNETLVKAYALALGKKYGHFSTGQLHYLLNKKEGLDISKGRIYSILNNSDKFARFEDNSYKSMGIPVFTLKGAKPEVKTESSVLSEDWDNYQSLEEIETKYLQKLMLAMGISTSDDRLPQVQEIFKTALKDAEMLGQLNSGKADTSNEPPTGV